MVFQLGKMVITSELNNAMEQNEAIYNFVWDSYKRYLIGDWGDLTDSDKELNYIAVATGNDRVLAMYKANGLDCDDIYIITEQDRTTTTLLFCKEY